MIKKVLITISILIASSDISYCDNYLSITTKNNTFGVAQFLRCDENSENCSAVLHDSISRSIINLYSSAVNAQNDKKLELSLSLYNQFLIITSVENFEKVFWKEIRLSYSHMSSIFEQLYNLDQANYYIKKALEISLRYDNNDNDNTFYFLNKIGQNFYNIFDYNTSLIYFHQAEALILSNAVLPLIKRSQLFNSMALCYFKLGHDNLSQYYLNESIKIKFQTGNLDDLASNYNNIGLIFQNKSQYKEALTFFTKCLHLYDSLENPIKSAFALNNIGNLFLDKNSFDTARYYYQKSLDTRNKVVNINKSDLTVSFNNLAFICHKLNLLDSALFYNNLALESNRKNDNGDNLSDAFSISDYLVSISDRIEINIRKYNATNDIKFLTESFDFFNPVITMIIDQLIKYNSIFSSNRFINEYKRFFDSSIASAHILDSIIKNKCPRTLIISETYKSLSLINLPSEICYIQDDIEFINHFSNVNKYNHWQQNLQKKNLSENAANILVLIDSLINSSFITDLINKKSIAIIKPQLLSYLNCLSDSIISTCNKLGNKLIIEYYISKTSIFTHILSKSEISCLVSPMHKGLIDAYKNYPISIKSLNKKLTSSLGTVLSRDLLLPVSYLIDTYENITIIPDEILTEIPFETLPYPANELSNNRNLVEKKNIDYRFTVLNRNFSHKQFTTSYSVDFIGITPFEPTATSLNNLNGSAREIADIANLYRDGNLNASALIGDSATYENFANISLDSRIIHFATHAVIDKQSSQLSFLELFPENNQNTLFLPVLAGMPFRSELLLLNACGTGRNMIEPSTGFVSFIRSVSSLSVKNYICTLWNIYDEPSYDFIINFYKKVLEGFSYSNALTLTKRDFINSENYNNPIFWSSFLLYENY